MKIFRSVQIKEIDDYTIKNEPISSVDLMERAAGQLFRWITAKFGRSGRIVIFVGPGNNGGDGLALARMLARERYETEVCYIGFTEKISSDWEVNRKRLESETSVKLNIINSSDQFPLVSADDLVVDAIFGSGLSRPVEGLAADIIDHINKTDATVLSVDVPSGLFGEDNSGNTGHSIVRAAYTLCFQFPKLSFLFAENNCFAGEWVVLPIGLSDNAIRNIKTPYSMPGLKDIASLLKKRNRFDHKGCYGHGLLIAGSYGKTGAAVLGARAALRTGIGLITCHIPSCGISVMQCAVPEAMVQPDNHEKSITDIEITDSFSAVGAGPGMGTGSESMQAIYKLLSQCKKPMVLDADALNILSLKKEWLSLLPAGTILTPHPKEFERLAGKTEDGYSRLMRQIEFSIEHKCIVVLKGAHTSVSTPEGNVMFNNTGNPGMATAGSGDVLTGIILSLLAQGYSPENAAILGVCLHGAAGDIAAEELGFEALIASDIINNIGKAFTTIRKANN